MLEKSSFQPASSLQRSGDCTVVRGAGAVSSTRSASSRVNACDSRVVRPPGRVAEREVAEQKARHADIFDDVLGAAHDHGRDAVLLRGAGRPDSRSGDTPVKPRRGRRRRPRPRGSAPAAPGILLERHAVAAVGRRAVKARRQLADPPGRGRRAAAPAAGTRCCCPRRCVLAVVADMRDAQIVVDRGVAGIDRVELGGGVVGRARPLVALVRLVGRRRRDQPDRGFRPSGFFSGANGTSA